MCAQLIAAFLCLRSRSTCAHWTLLRDILECCTASQDFPERRSTSNRLCLSTMLNSARHRRCFMKNWAKLAKKKTTSQRAGSSGMPLERSPHRLLSVIQRTVILNVRKQSPRTSNWTCNRPKSYALPTRGQAGFGGDSCLMDQLEPFKALFNCVS